MRGDVAYFVDLNGKPAARGLSYFCIFYAEESWYGRAGEINVEDANGVTLEAEGER